MSQKSAMRYCPDCKAPNPASRAECYACGQSLLAAPSSAQAAAPGERTYPCLTCRTAVPYTATVCPGCGRDLRSGSSPVPPVLKDGLTPQQAAAMNLVTFAETPGGWTPEPLPDGTIRLSRTGWQRIWRDASPLFVVIGAGFWVARLFLLRSVTGTIRDAQADLVTLMVFGVVGILALCWAIWSLFGREELRIGASLLEVRKTLGPFRWVRRIEQGVLRLNQRTVYSRYGRHIVWDLIVDNRRGGITLDSRKQSLLWDGAQPHAELGQLARYIALHTGWPFVNPMFGG